MRKIHFLSLAPLVLTTIFLLVPTSASAVPHYYLQLTGFEEFKPITTTTDATFASNGELEFYFVRNSKEFNLHCHAEGRTKLYTNGTAGIYKLEVSSCNVNVSECVVKPNVYGPSEEAQWLSELSGSSTTGYYNTLHSSYFENQGVVFEVSNCSEYAGLYSFGTYSTLKAQVYNGITVEYVLPEPQLLGTTFVGMFGLQAPKHLYGRLRVSPVIGQALKVGP